MGTKCRFWIILLFKRRGKSSRIYFNLSIALQFNANFPSTNRIKNFGTRFSKKNYVANTETFQLGEVLMWLRRLINMQIPKLSSQMFSISN